MASEPGRREHLERRAGGRDDAEPDSGDQVEHAEGVPEMEHRPVPRRIAGEPEQGQGHDAGDDVAPCRRMRERTGQPACGGQHQELDGKDPPDIETNQQRQRQAEHRPARRRPGGGEGGGDERRRHEDPHDRERPRGCRPSGGAAGGGDADPQAEQGGEPQLGAARRRHEDEQRADDEDDQGRRGDGPQEIEHDGPPNDLTEGLPRQKMFNIIFCAPLSLASRERRTTCPIRPSTSRTRASAFSKAPGGCSTARASPRSRSARSWRMPD